MAPPTSPVDAAQWETIAAAARTLQGNPGSTIEPQTGRGPAATVDDAGAAGRLELHEVIGEGGMGVVRLATQRSMGRTVAVKALRPARRAPEPTRKLLQEAWTTGRLEHPNIVPIYDIAMEDDGNPLIVLKRIEGESWSRLLAEPELAADLVDGADPLDRHLRILGQVCRALHFAHSRGVVHLDLKPDNVMLGRHGEVYLVDWGVAMALRDDGQGQLPLAAEHRGIVGTPCYMAPEMLEGDGRTLDARTDVYLLGATLFEVLAGRPPHGGETIMEVLHTALTETPSLPDDAPAELAEICRRAMARDPAERYASVEELRQAVQAFEQHRESARMEERARERLTELEASLDGDDVAERNLHELFAQARFGFEQALDSWSDNEPAAAGLARAFAVMIELQLRRGDPQVCAALASEAPSLPDELRRRVEEAVARRQASLDELASRRRDQDLRIGQRTRALVTVLLGIVWTVAPAFEYFFSPTRTQTEAFLFYGAVPVVSLVMLTGLTIWARESLTGTRVNRGLVTAFFLATGSHLMILVAFAALGIAPQHHFMVMLPIWAALTAQIVISIERRALPIPIMFMAGFGVTLARPDLSVLVVTVCDLAFVVILAWIWWPERLRGPIPEPDHRA